VVRARGTRFALAPEQVEGREITSAADVYALGVVMYEMVSGRLPFVGESPLSTAVMRLREAPVTPCAHVADLDPRWERTILACLAIFFILAAMARRKRFDGQVTLAYVILYAIVRFVIEFYRGDAVRGSVFGGTLSTSQFIALLMVLAAAVALPYVSKRNRVSPPPPPAPATA
jgi:serine/threonine protein kinase